MMNLPHPLILGSNSPRRKEILENAGFTFTTKSLDVDESFNDELSILNIAEYLAVKKNTAYQKIFKNHIILTADTTVIVNETLLNKPSDSQEANKMLQMLSGRKHEVVTGVCISTPTLTLNFSESTDVYFKNLAQEEIDYYISQYKPFDKAGAYGIQEWIGMIGITKMVGSYYNVMGLPIDRVYEELDKFKN